MTTGPAGDGGWDHQNDLRRFGFGLPAAGGITRVIFNGKDCQRVDIFNQDF